MNDKLQQRLLSIGTASFSLAISACDLSDKNIGETGQIANGDGDSTGDDDFEGECDPPDPNVTFSYEPLDFGGDEFADANINKLCTVVAADVAQGMYLELDCPETANPVIVDVTATPILSLPVLVGDIVRVRYIRVVTTWIDTYLSLETEGGDLLFTVIDAATLFPPYGPPFNNDIDMGTGIGSTFMGCSPGTNQCGTLERIRVHFDNDGPILSMMDGSYLEIEPYPTLDVWLVAAREVENPGVCPDTPVGWYSMLIAAGQP